MIQNYKTLNLETLRQGISGIDADFGAYLATTAVVCFLLQGHQKGVLLEVYDHNQTLIEIFEVVWEKQLTQKDFQSYKDRKDLANYAGMAVAILLILQLTDYQDFERTESSGAGVDFWLRKATDSFDFESFARLEVSAILSATEKNKLQTRLKQKIIQSKQSDDTFTDAYVIVTDFNKPESFYHIHLVEKL